MDSDYNHISLETEGLTSSKNPSTWLNALTMKPIWIHAQICQETKKQKSQS